MKNIVDSLRNISFLFLILFSIEACHSSRGESNGTKVFQNKLIIRSPGQCTHLLQFNGSGDGKLTFGAVNSVSFKEEFVNFDYIVRESEFKIVARKDIDSLNTLIRGFESDRMVKSTQPHDSYRYELFIGDAKKVDVYGIYADTLNKIFSILNKYYPFKIDSTCF
jgi:hypothetical protein